jgi:hypothetical protein
MSTDERISIQQADVHCWNPGIILRPTICLALVESTKLSGRIIRYENNVDQRWASKQSTSRDDFNRGRRCNPTWWCRSLKASNRSEVTIRCKTSFDWWCAFRTIVREKNYRSTKKWTLGRLSISSRWPEKNFNQTCLINGLSKNLIEHAWTINRFDSTI